MDSAPSTIVIELEPDATPIRGAVRSDGGSAVKFSGWTGLFAVLRAATGERPEGRD